MKSKQIVSLVVNILWLLIAGILGAWIGKSELPWLVVEILIVAIGVLGINQVISEARK